MKINLIRIVTFGFPISHASIVGGVAVFQSVKRTLVLVVKMRCT